MTGGPEIALPPVCAEALELKVPAVAKAANAAKHVTIDAGPRACRPTENVMIKSSFDIVALVIKHVQLPEDALFHTERCLQSSAWPTTFASRFHRRALLHTGATAKLLHSAQQAWQKVKAYGVVEFEVPAGWKRINLGVLLGKQQSESLRIKIHRQYGNVCAPFPLGLGAPPSDWSTDFHRTLSDSLSVLPPRQRLAGWSS